MSPNAAPPKPAVSNEARWAAARWVLGGVLAAFALVNAVVLLLEPYFLHVLQYDQQHTSARIIDYYRLPRPDIMFMGTSRALSGFDPIVAESEIEHLTGTKVHAHNIALTGGTIEIQYLILKNIIREDKQPKVIVYGLSEAEFAAIPTNPIHYLPYTNILLRPDDFPRYADTSIDSKIGFWVDQIFPLYRDRRIIRDALSIAFNPNDPAHKFYIQGAAHRDPAPNGFIPGSGHARAPTLQLEQNHGEYAPLLRNFRFDYQRLDTFHQFLALAQRRGIKVILVNMPVDEQLRKLWESEERVAQYRAMMQTLADDHHVPLLDLYRGWDGFPEDGLWDLHHLNEVGAAAVTRLVADTHLARIFGGVPEGLSPTSTSPSPETSTTSTKSKSEDVGRALIIQGLYPEMITQGEGFNVQANGQSAIALRIANATVTSVIVFAGTRLATAYNANDILTAEVPMFLTAAPGRYPVHVSDGTRNSNTVDFLVNRSPTTAEAETVARSIVIQALYPETITQGKAFNVQPDGQSAIAVQVTDATAASVIVFAGTRLATVYNPNNILTAKLPASLTTAPGRYPVYVSDGSTVSNTVDFVINRR